jgi:hypothetical protein
MVTSVPPRFTACMHKIHVGCRSGADNVRTFPAGELDREGANAASRTLNQDTPARLQISVIKKTLPGSSRANGDGGGLVKADRCWFERELVYRGSCVFGISSQ